MIGEFEIVNGAKVSIDTAKSKEVVAELMLGGTAARVPMKQGLQAETQIGRRRGSRVER